MADYDEKEWAPVQRDPQDSTVSTQPAPYASAPQNPQGSANPQTQQNPQTPLQPQAPQAPQTPLNSFPASPQPGQTQAPSIPMVPPFSTNAYGANAFYGTQPLTYTPDSPRGPESPDVAPPRPYRAHRGPGWGGLIAACVITALITTGGVVGLTAYINHEYPTEVSSTLFDPGDSGDVTTPEPVTNSTSQNPDWERVSKAVRASVVAIDVSNPQEDISGSGVILDGKGHILTNNHVVAPGAMEGGKIQVVLADGRIYNADIVGLDPMTDLAVIRLSEPPKDLTVAILGDSDKLAVGQSIAAIGNPLGLSSTMTTGIISALNRPVSVRAVDPNQPEQQSPDLPFLLRNSATAAPTQVITNAIQVDAAINPGNSGGPLFDAQGRVIGINSSIASLSDSEGTAGSIGVGFAIPINMAKMISQQLINNGQAQHSFLGVVVRIGEATADGVTRRGAQVTEVQKGTAAAQAGIHVGDVIVEIDGHVVTSEKSLTGWVRRYPAGAEVTIVLVRDGKQMQVKAKLQTRTEK